MNEDSAFFPPFLACGGVVVFMVCNRISLSQRGSNRLIEMFGESACVCVFVSVVHMVCALHIDIHANN